MNIRWAIPKIQSVPAHLALIAMIFSCLTGLSSQSLAQSELDTTPSETSTFEQRSFDPSLFQIQIGKEMLVQLAKLPPEGPLRNTFLNLSQKEQTSFYLKRKVLMQKMVGGLTRPGIGSGIRWTKNKVSSLISMVKGWKNSLFPAAEIMVDPKISEESDGSSAPNDLTANELIWLKQPPHLTDKAQAFVNQTVSAYLDSFWKNSAAIAKSNGVGMTFVLGAIWNTTLGNWGDISGRSLSIDIGMDFSTQEGYMRLVWDKQTKKTGGLSFDVGVLFDALLHVTDSGLQKGDIMEATHTKLPIVGCFRSGENYKAWGAQLGVSVIEMGVFVTNLLGYGHSDPSAALTSGAIVTGMRAIGIATVYQTNLERHILMAKTIPKNSKIMRLLRLDAPGSEQNVSTLSCHSIFR